jgi:hypothetical protein
VRSVVERRVKVRRENEGKMGRQQELEIFLDIYEMLMA